MGYEVLHIYGPISIQWYGFMIFMGIMIFSGLVVRDPLRAALVSTDDLFAIMARGIIIGIIGGRALFLVTNASAVTSPVDVVAIWDGGFSLLGSVAGIVLLLPAYMRRKGVESIALCDLMVVYAPLMIAISRLGCLGAGCCYGVATTMPWGITYTAPECAAPTHCALHPTQIYSCILLCILFFFMRYVLRPSCMVPGQLTALFIVLASCERFFVDFWRGDREFLSSVSGVANTFSIHQYVALALVAAALAAYAKTGVREQKI